MLDHKIIYNTKTISSDYGARDYLEGPEKAILQKLKPELPGMSMLDMGVGGGRTTKYFAPLAGEYIGADYAPEMLKICRAKYPGRYEFIECDVRYMNRIQYDRFDFVLFSYNGIDSFNHEQRIIALKEIKRVLRPGGYFAFSTHNLDWKGLPELFRLNNKISRLKYSGKSPVGFLGTYIKAGYSNLRLNLLNKSFSMHNLIKKLRENERGYLYDNSLDGRASIYYTTHKEQVRQLERIGFTGIMPFSQSGRQTGHKTGLKNSAWIYYLCRKR
ncbi:MAG: class I SAM-dependent methyltransferase [Candidatus Humimicrobiaceae bacterium]